LRFLMVKGSIKKLIAKRKKRRQQKMNKFENFFS
jgi:hypothetical protein